MKQRGSIRRFLTTTKPNINENQDDQSGSSSHNRIKIIEKLKSEQLPQQQPLQQTKISSFLTGVKQIKSPRQTQMIANDEAIAVNKALPNQSEKWRQLLETKSKIEQIPLCTGHGLPCVRRKVRKSGTNHGREFYQCSKPSLKPEGHPETRCNFFQWIK
ncbi:hypothetical protein BLA29_009688 [Euroglyphus maynei]|uniref:GRF-type domain-containing protein n=1 Tax=Euroglyphus maynei TaxID=6958 RepID=A0A1Y3B801_EURMA|nr:hypothetical protein BLA29_009688 [Euroglyphus maynei]